MGSYTGTIPTILAGELVTADKLIEYYNICQALSAQWTTYTVTWGSDATQPTLGNGTLTGSYRRIGKTVDFRVKLVFGSTTNGGSGNWVFSLPVTAASSDAAAGGGSAYNSGVADYVITVAPHGTTVVYLASASGTVNPSVPFAFGTADWVQFGGSYEVA